MSDDDDFIRKLLADPKRDAELLAKGADISLYPLAGWSTATLPENNKMVALQLLVPGPQISVRTVRLGITAAQCSELAKVLERLARTPHLLPPAKPN